jgi:hypothetical protein
LNQRLTKAKDVIMNAQMTTSRAGKNHRMNHDRYFHVMAQGWFMYTREGIQGPFIDREHAQNYLSKMLEDRKGEQDPSASWRL